jgi:hypothetical protein
LGVISLLSQKGYWSLIIDIEAKAAKIVFVYLLIFVREIRHFGFFMKS